MPCTGRLHVQSKIIIASQNPKTPIYRSIDPMHACRSIRRPATGRLFGAAAAAFVLHEFALAAGIALEAGGAGGRLACPRARLGAAPALQADGRPRQYCAGAAGDRHHHLLRRLRLLRHHVVVRRHLIVLQCANY